MALDPGFQLDFVVNLEVSVVPPGFVSWSWGVLHVSKAGYSLAVGFVTLAQPLPCEGTPVCPKDW